MRDGLARVIWTTNFDTLVADACAKVYGGTSALTTVTLDAPEVAADAIEHERCARSTPRPIRLVRHAGHGSWEDTARAILGLTKMNWNNDSLYDPLPVTMGFASVLAGVVKRIDDLRDIPYQFRFFM